MAEKFSEYELEQISKLPKDIAVLADKYKIDIVNAGEVWGEPAFYSGYNPRAIEIYYGSEKEPSISTLDGKLDEYNVSEPDDKSKSLAVMFDGQWGYIQVEGKVIIDRLGGIIFPEIIVEPSTLIQSILNKFT